MGPLNYCCVLGCKAGYKTDRKERVAKGERNLSLFQPPRDDLRFAEWQKNIPTNRELTKMDRICELHFSESDIERFYITKLKNGLIHKMERNRPSLKPNVMPRFFLDSPDYWVNYLKIRKPNTGQVITFIDKEIENDASFSKDPIPNLIKDQIRKESIDVTGVSTETRLVTKPIVVCVKRVPSPEPVVVPEKEKCVTNQELKENSSTLDQLLDISCLSDKIRSVELPNEWWSVHHTPKFIICAKWDKSHLPERRVVFQNDLSVKVFLKDYQIQEKRRINTIAEVSCLLFLVDKYQICAGLGDESMPDCEAYIHERKETRGRFTLWCRMCRVTRKRRAVTAWRRHRKKPAQRSVGQGLSSQALK